MHPRMPHTGFALSVLLAHQVGSIYFKTAAGSPKRPPKQAPKQTPKQAPNEAPS